MCWSTAWKEGAAAGSGEDCEHFFATESSRKNVCSSMTEESSTDMLAATAMARNRWRIEGLPSSLQRRYGAFAWVWGWGRLQRGLPQNIHNWSFLVGRRFLGAGERLDEAEREWRRTRVDPVVTSAINCATAEPHTAGGGLDAVMRRWTKGVQAEAAGAGCVRWGGPGPAARAYRCASSAARCAASLWRFAQLPPLLNSTAAIERGTPRALSDVQEFIKVSYNLVAARAAADFGNAAVCVATVEGRRIERLTQEDAARVFDCDLMEVAAKVNSAAGRCDELTRS